MSAVYHTIILGQGAMGTATAAQLARRLAAAAPHERILGLEQFDIPNDLGSSHGQSRLIRLAYYEHPDYVPLLRRAYTLWREIESRHATRLLHVTGGLYIGPPDHELIKGSLESARRHNLAHALLTPRELAERYPQFRVPADLAVFFEADAGFLLPEKAVAAHAAEAQAHGAELHTFEPALEWSVDAGGIVTVRTDRDTYRARHFVITAGPWTSRLLPFLHSAITVTRQSLFWFAPNTPAAYSLGQFPCWCAASDSGGLIYGPPILPEESAPPGLKISHHFPGRAVDPDHVTRTLEPGDADVVTREIAALLPGVDTHPLAHRVCLYSNSPDHHFLIDRHPDHANVFLAAGFSGHGFKFAPVIGEILADLALTGQTAHPIDVLRLNRLT